MSTPMMRACPPILRRSQSIRRLALSTMRSPWKKKDTHWFCEFQIRTGEIINKLTSVASNNPGLKNQVR